MAKSQRGIGIVMSYVSVAIGFLTTIIYTPLINKTLGMETYGAYSWALSIIQYLSLLQGGLYATFTRFYSRLKEKGDKKGLAELNGLFLCIYIIIGIIAFFAGMVIIQSIGNIIPIPSNINPEEVDKLRFLMVLMVINLSIDFPTYIFLSNIIVREQYFFSRLMNIIKQITSPLIGIPLLLLGVGSASLIIATLAATIIFEVLSIWFCFTKIHIRFRFNWPKLSYLKEIFTFSFFIFLNLIVDQINWSIDKNLLGIYTSTIQVGIYTNADQLSQYFFSFASTISDVFTPKVHRIVAADKPNANRELTKLFTQVGRLQFMLLSLITVGFIAVGKPFINYYAKGYIEVYYVAIILFFSSFISAIQYLGIPILQAKNQHSFKAILNFSVVFLNVAISIPLCQRFGAIGSALGTFFSNIFINGFVINWYYATRSGLNLRYFWRNIIHLARGLVVPIGVMLFIVLVVQPSNLLSMLIWGVVVVIIYGISMIKWGMNRQEKAFVFKVLSKVIKI